MRIDASPTNKNDFGPGVYLADIKGCEVKHSQRTGDPYFNVSWHDAGAFGAGKFICFDIIMLAGKGRSIGLAKLKVLGFEECVDDGGPAIEAEPQDLIGRRAWIRIGWDEYKTSDGTVHRNLKVKTEFEPKFSSGYTNEKTPPEDANDGSTVPILEEDVPF